VELPALISIKAVTSLLGEFSWPAFLKERDLSHGGSKLSSFKVAKSNCKSKYKISLFLNLLN
jgi:hypothetical protein